MPKIKNGIGPDHIANEVNDAGDTVKSGIGPDHIVESLECPEPDYTGLLQYPPDIDGIDDHVVVSSEPLVWDRLPTIEDDNGSLRLINDDHPLYKVYAFDADWDNSHNSYTNYLTWLVDVLQFRNNQISNGQLAFNNVPFTTATALPDLDTSNLTDMDSMFYNCYSFNQRLDNWDTSNVVSFGSMFYGCHSFNQPLNWNTGKVRWMSHTFSHCKVFNQPLNWNTRECTSMGSMFFRSPAFNQDLSHWCVPKIDSKPSNFDWESGFQGQTAKQPKWGQPC